MTLPLLIALALAVPVLVLLAFYAFSKSIPWLGARPRLTAGLEILIGAANLVTTVVQARRGFEAAHLTSLILGLGFLGGGLHRWFRGTPVRYE